MKVFLIVVMAVAFLATCFMENKAIAGVVGLVAVVVFIKMQLNELDELREEEEKSINQIDEELYDKEQDAENKLN